MVKQETQKGRNMVHSSIFQWCGLFQWFTSMVHNILVLGGSDRRWRSCKHDTNQRSGKQLKTLQGRCYCILLMGPSAMDLFVRVRSWVYSPTDGGDIGFRDHFLEALHA